MKTIINKVLALLDKKERCERCGEPLKSFDKDYATPSEELKAMWNYNYEKMKDTCMNIPSPEGAKWCQENNIDLGSCTAQIITYIKLLEANFEALSIESNKLIEEYEELEKQIKQQD